MSSKLEWLFLGPSNAPATGGASRASIDRKSPDCDYANMSHRHRKRGRKIRRIKTDRNQRREKIEAPLTGGT